MQLLTLAGLTALTATVSAKINISYQNNATCDYNKPRARIVNRCSYDVYVWTVDSDNKYDCKFDEPVVLGTGEAYAENFRPTTIGAVSIKVSKEEACTNGKITQLEYNYKPNVNFLDISFVNCHDGDCPGRQDGYYLHSGNTEDGQFKSAENNEHCPICSAHDQASADECAYVLPDDRQTRSCSKEANLDFYICGSEAPGSEPAPSKPEPSKEPEKEKPKPSTKAPAPTTTAPPYNVDNDVAAAAVTDAPQAANGNIKTVFETVYAYTTVLPHRHRRHQHIHA
ncbi:hypothetical protein K458DRAFT_388839 [Lentithecium fluviatile CBS 122367]|uniref:Lytic polysaccharide monooxygenase n=1 Tax=Lentithecium fluviatile CBS 122367 TaxID=1168545 RepID=A0A6G1J2D8_9PLEO|nr:hypothetical protein K458DRAFT_388839 [Lentithecium fluviatile CBS 122367]